MIGKHCAQSFSKIIIKLATKRVLGGINKRTALQISTRLWISIFLLFHWPFKLGDSGKVFS